MPLLLFQLATWISSSFKTPSGSSVMYLTMAFGILMVNWWGPRVALMLAVSTWLNMLQFNMAFTAWNLFTSLRGPISLAISWGVFRWLLRGDTRLPSINQLIAFVAFGIFLPLTFNASFKFVQVIDDPQRWIIFLSFWLPDVLTNLAFTVPVMILVSPWLLERDWVLKPPARELTPIPAYPGRWYELVLLCAISLVLHVFLSFERFWFLFGVFSIYASIRFGLRIVSFFNFYIFAISYILPVFLKEQEPYQMAKFYDIHLGMCLLFIFSLVTARIMKDVRAAREQLARQNHQLEEAIQNLQQTNTELDRFVYSVSHDLSAPLKSVKGLVHLSKMEGDPSALPLYLEKIDVSVNKLEEFIREVLDYARSKRKDVVTEQVSLSQLTHEILDHIKYLDNFKSIEITTRWEVETVVTDRTRLKIILNNLIANAVKYHPVREREKPVIQISSRQTAEGLCIEVADNGAGIAPEIRDRIFDMFFRGAADVSGSGLGLYIAREAADKIRAKITVASHVGEGSTFSIHVSSLRA